MVLFQMNPLSYPKQAAPLLRIRNLNVHFPIYRGVFFRRQIGAIKALDGVSFDIQRGETLGLVGESGSGKTTTAQAILQMIRPTQGDVYFEDINLTQLNEEAVLGMRQRMQMVFQDPYGTLNPHKTIGDLLSEPLDNFGVVGGLTRLERIVQLLEMVGLDPECMYRTPYEFSSGQRQRIVIARAMAVNPEFIVCDEPLATLDIATQAQIINLLQKLQSELGLTYLFIAHDLSVVRNISDRIAVMYAGKVVELADRATLYSNPLHPYTQALLSTMPIQGPLMEVGRQQARLQGQHPNPANPPQGCRFHPRCPLAQDRCRQEPEPNFQDVGYGHYVACHMVP
ncbi:ABC transporter ATP-binding protein [Leptolyngbya sp. FACHB-16]|uniref:ABC transporter ATP-binding protein n=1 Tax=unclassified Leptolyngbya TaxID=2650499 RepID=UPI001686C716|nr:ABC transporter ATP-binding protein [Leptolyngbya sp. FACHB-16]MBD2158087.1 ABC transporter ATP-binding protein [Leptolyngbya sp. FACHB-16]